jgi:hypothetical protein
MNCVGSIVSYINNFYYHHIVRRYALELSDSVVQYVMDTLSLLCT